VRVHLVHTNQSALFGLLDVVDTEVMRNFECNIFRFNEQELELFLNGCFEENDNIETAVEQMQRDGKPVIDILKFALKSLAIS